MTQGIHTPGNGNVDLMLQRSASLHNLDMPEPNPRVHDTAILFRYHDGLHIVDMPEPSPRPSATVTFVPATIRHH